MNKVILLLGSNLGNRSNFLNRAIELINSKVGSITKVSSVYESEPWGFSSTNLFLNQVIIIETDYQPIETLNILQNTEKELGRKLNSKSYQNRTIDIDILFFNEIQMNSKELTIPHPQLHLREFTMIPLIEVAGDFIHPVFGERLDLLFSKSTGNRSVKVLEISKQPLTLRPDEV